MINQKYCPIHKNQFLVQICGNQNCQRDKLMCIECFNEHQSENCRRGLSFQTIENNLTKGTIKDYKIEYDKIKYKIDHSIQTVIKKLQDLKLLIENQYKTIFNKVDYLLSLKKKALEEGVWQLQVNEIKEMKSYFCDSQYENVNLREQIQNMNEKAQNLLEWVERINFNQHGNNPTDGESIANKQNYQIYYNYQGGILNGDCFYKIIDRQTDQKEKLGTYRNGKKDGEWKQILLVREDDNLNKYCALYQSGIYNEGKKIGEWAYYYEDYKLCSQYYNNYGQLDGREIVQNTINLFKDDINNYGISKSKYLKGVEVEFLGFETNQFPHLGKSKIRKQNSEIDPRQQNQFASTRSAILTIIPRRQQ
ncbi:hypothetical protein pb186bvf_012992 [Paramecium bursaria]